MAQAIAHLADQRLVGLGGPAEDAQADVVKPAAPPKDHERLDERVQALGGRHLRHESHRPRFRRRRGRGQAGRVDCVVNHMESFGRQIEAMEHLPAVEIARRDERVDLGGPGAQDFPRPRAVRVVEAVDVAFLVLERADDRHLEHVLHPPYKPNQQDVGQRDHVRMVVLGQERHEAVELFDLPAVGAAEHGQHRLGHVGPLGHACLSAGPSQQPGRVKEAVEPPRRPAEEAALLLEVDVDATEEDLSLELPIHGGVGHHRQVKRHAGRVVPDPPQRQHKRRVAQAVLAVEAAARSRTEMHELHCLASNAYTYPSSQPTMTRPAPTAGLEVMGCPRS